jgi:hypothetical protein
MDGQGNLYRYPDDADRGQTMRPLYFEQPNMNSPERIFHTDEKEFFELRKRMYERLNPPKREWVGLTTEEILGLQDFAYADDIEFVNHIEAILKEKNT